MLQRIQTIYLFISVVCLTLLVWFPIFSIEVSSEITVNMETISQTLTGDFGIYGLTGDFSKGEFPIFYYVLVLQLLTLLGILFFKNRPRQLLICRLNLILTFIFVGVVYVFYYAGPGIIKNYLPAEVKDAAEITFYMAPGFFLVIPPLAFLLLAIRAIKRDEKLVKSLDRLR